MRVLGAARESKTSDTSTSLAGQDEQIRRWCSDRGHTLVAVISDDDTSGSVPPHKRENLGPWLAEESRLHTWDILVATKTDRLSRSTLDFDLLLKWAADHGKLVVTTAEAYDVTTANGRFMAKMLSNVAELEREIIRQRCHESHQRTRAVGRWHGGRFPYGYMPVDTGRGWNLVPDPEKVQILEWIAEALLGGRSARDICRDLNSRNVPAPVGKEWRGGALTHMLRSPALKGYVVTKGETVRAADGLPVRREPVLPDEIWQQIQAVLARSPKAGQRRNASLLLRVAFCGRWGCGQPLYLNDKRDRGYIYYTCGSRLGAQRCGERGVRGDLLESIIEDRLLEDLGHVPMQVRRVIPGEENSKQIAELEEGIANLEAQAVDDPLKADTYVRMIGKLEDRRDKLAALPVREESVEWVPVEPRQTFADHWASLDRQGRHSFLLGSKVRVFVSHLDPDEPVGFPMPDPRGTVIRMVGNGLQITICLGDLAELRDRASRTSQVARVWYPA